MRPSLPVILATLSLLACAEEGTPPADRGDDTGTADTGTPPVEGPAFEIALAAAKLPIPQGETVGIEVTVTRTNGFEGPVQVTATGLPEGVSAASIAIAADEDRGTLELVAEGEAPHSLPTSVTVLGTSGDLEDEEALTVTVTGRPGALDTSFGDGGEVLVPMGASDDYAYAMAVQADGRIVVAGQSAEGLGDVALLRLDRDGSPDATFGDGGVVTTAIGDGTSDVAYAVAVQADGKILVAGSTTSVTTGKDFALLRYDADGTLDEGFGEGGVVTTAISTDSDTAYALLVQPDGRIVVGGEANLGSASTGVDFALARYLADGRLDPDFGEGGVVTTALAAHGGRDTIYALALEPVDGGDRILAVGGEGDFTIARYLEDGALDASFADGGRLVGLVGSTIGAARAVGIDGEGRIVVAGHAHHDFTIVRLDEGGDLDPSFGEDGVARTAVSAENWDEARGLAIDEEGGVVVGGWVYEGNSSSGDFALVRYDEEGALDPSFGPGGVVITAGIAPNKRDEGAAVVLQADERVPTVRVLVAGSATGATSDFAVARYWR